MQILKHILLLCLLLLAGSRLPAQDMRVVARAGLMLRTGPSVTAKAIIHMPFGTLVERAGWADGAPEHPQPQITVAGREGTWIEVRWGNRRGWAFDAWLSPNTAYHRDQYAGLAVFRSGSPSCRTPLLPLDSIPGQYGLFDLGAGKLELRPLRISYFCGTAEARDWLGTEISDPQAPEWLLLSDTPLPTGTFPGYADLSAFRTDDQGSCWIPEMDFRFTAQARGDTTCLTDLYLEHRDRSQHIPLKAEIPACWGSVHLLLAGDLDRDGIPDCILRKDHWERRSFEVWLSSRAAPGEILGLAMRVMEPGCCG